MGGAGSPDFLTILYFFPPNKVLSTITCNKLLFSS